MDKAFAGVQGIRKIVNDVVVFDEDEQHMEHAYQRDPVPLWRGISLNRANCCPQAHFAGFMLTHEGYPISNDMIDAITNFLTPSSCTDLHSFICLTNQLTTCT